jgi:hypothetical protein
MYDPKDVAWEVDMPLFMEYTGGNREMKDDDVNL